MFTITHLVILIISVLLLIFLGWIIWRYVEKYRKEQDNKPQPGTFGESCNPEASSLCASGLTCSGQTNITSGVCKRSDGQGCTADSDCISTSVCLTSGVCGPSTSGNLNQTCRNTAPACNTGLACVSGFCKGSAGYTCQGGTDCVSGICDNFVCAGGQAGAIGSGCVSDAGCTTGLICSSSSGGTAGYCQFPQAPTGLIGAYCGAYGPYCATGSRCRNNMCLPITGTFSDACDVGQSCSRPTLTCNTTQGLCLYPGTGISVNTCNVTGACDAGLACYNQVCTVSQYGPCNNNTVCFSGNCVTSAPSGGNSYVPYQIGASYGLTQTELASGLLFNRVYVRSSTNFDTLTTTSGYAGIYSAYLNDNNYLRWNAASGNVTTGGYNYLVMDFTTNSKSQYWTVHQVNQGTIVLGSVINSIPFSGSPNFIMIGGQQYDPLEIDCTDNGDLVATAVLHANSQSPSILISRPAGTTAWNLISTPSITSSITKPRFYRTTGNSISLEFGYQVGNTIILSGSLSGISYTSRTTIYDYAFNSTGTFPRVSILVNVLDSSSQFAILMGGIMAYGGAIVNPRQGWVTSGTKVNLLNPTTPCWITNQLCQ